VAVPAEVPEVHQAIHEPEMGTEAEVQQAESESESESDSEAARHTVLQTANEELSDGEIPNDEERVPYSSAGPSNAFWNPSKRRKVTTNNVVRYDDGLPDWTSGFHTKSHGVSDNRNAYISDGCFHIQNTQEPLFAKVASKSDTTIDSIITDAMNSVLIEVLIKRYQNANPTVSIPFQRLYNSYHVEEVHGKWIASDMVTDNVALLYVCAPGKTVTPSLDNPAPSRDAIHSMHMLIKLLKHASHKVGFMHNDLHTKNVLYDKESGKFTIIDYGRATFDDTFVTQNIQECNTVLKLGVLEKKDYKVSKFRMLHPRSGQPMISLDTFQILSPFR
jgi:serine/threonine protein kinase